MERLTREQFVERFPLLVPALAVRGVQKTDLIIDRSSMLAGLVQGNVTVRAGAGVIGHGIITGDLTVEANAILYFDGIVKGKVHILGAACVMGIFDGFESDAGACVAIEPDSKIGGDSAS